MMPEPEFESKIDQSLAELESLEIARKEGGIEMPEPNSPEWQEIRRLDFEWGEKLRPILSGIEITELIEPEGDEGRSLNQERKKFLESLNDPESDFNPTFTYPNLSKIDLEAKETQLSEFRDEIKVSGRTEQSKSQRIITKLYHYKINEELAKIRWLRAVRDGNDRHAFHYANFIWGQLTQKDISLAHQRFEEMLDVAGQEKNNTWQEDYQDLDEEIYGPEDIKTFFEEVLREYSLEDEWRVEITDEVSAITDQYRHEGGARIAIPVDRDKVSAVKMLELSAHEIEAHALSSINGSLSGLLILSGDIQPDRVEDFEEGKAVIRQNQSQKEIFGENFPESGGLPYYILAMEQARAGKNFRETFKAVEKMRYQYELKMTQGNETKARDRARKQTWVTCRRVFRSINDLSLGGKFFPKDKAYLIGRQEVENVIKSSHESWLDVGKINWRILPEIFQFGIIPENIRHPYQNATKAVWERKLLARHKKQK